MATLTTRLDHGQANQLIDTIIALIKRCDPKKPFYICILDSDGEILDLKRYNFAGIALQQAAVAMAREGSSRQTGEQFCVGLGIDLPTGETQAFAQSRPHSWVETR